MSLQPRRLQEVPEETARIAHAAFPKGNVYMRLRDELGMLMKTRTLRRYFPRSGSPPKRHGGSRW